MPCQHVVWDWNGTLLDDAWLCLDIVNGQLRRRGLATASLAHYQSVFGFPVQNYYRRLGFEFTDESFENIAHEFMAEYKQRRCECNLHDHALDVLKQIATSGVGQSILSMYKQDELSTITEYFGVKKFMTHTVGLEHHFATSKLEIGQRLITTIGYSTSQIILFGDTDHDYDVATALGIRCILVAGGHQSTERLLSFAPSYLPDLSYVPKTLNLP